MIEYLKFSDFNKLQQRIRNLAGGNAPGDSGEKAEDSVKIDFVIFLLNTGN